MQLARLGISLLLLTGCKSERESEGPRREDSEPAASLAAPDPPPRPDVPEWTEPRREHVLVLAHESTARGGHVRALDIGDAAGRLKAPLAVPAVPSPNRPDEYRVLAAYDGADAFVVVAGDAAPWKLEWRSLDGSTIREVELGEEPAAAVHLVGQRAFIGQGNGVLSVDFSAPDPLVEQLHERPEMSFKAYDLFARDGSWLIAIDDVVTPFYADSFELHGTKPRRWAGYELPGAINGHYQFALLHATGPGSGTLYAIIPYGIMSGSGHDLVALPMRDATPVIDSEVIVNDGVQSSVAVLEEHVPRGIGRRKLLVGSHFTPWMGLARIERAGNGRLLIAAGDRGLLSVSDEFTATSKATQLDVDGTCLDVLSKGERVFVIRGPRHPKRNRPGETSLVELSVDGDTATPITSIELDSGDSRFVR